MTQPPPTVGLDATTRVLLALTGLMAVTISVVIYMAVFVHPDATSMDVDTETPAAADALRCNASSVETQACPDNHYCRFDTCVPLDRPLACSAGESCRDCDCAAGLVCHHNRCVDQDRVDRAPLICQENERLSAAVKTLAAKCAERKKSVDDIVTSGACSVADWEELALEDEEFDLLLAAFPNRFAVHFPVGRPHLKGRDWPSSGEREHALGQLRGFREPLTSAKQIFVIGRASPDGSQQTNHLLALGRMTLVSELIHTVIYEGIPETQRSQKRIRIRSFTLPTSKPIDPKRYKSTYLDNPPGLAPLPQEPLVTWDTPSLRSLKEKLADPALLARGNGREWDELFNAVNRVVLVIPIPCLGDEYRPPINDLARPAAAEGPSP